MHLLHFKSQQLHTLIQMETTHKEVKLAAPFGILTILYVHSKTLNKSLVWLFWERHLVFHASENAKWMSAYKRTCMNVSVQR